MPRINPVHLDLYSIHAAAKHWQSNQCMQFKHENKQLYLSLKIKEANEVRIEENVTGRGTFSSQK